MSSVSVFNQSNYLALSIKSSYFRWRAPVHALGFLIPIEILSIIIKLDHGLHDLSPTVGLAVPFYLYSTTVTSGTVQTLVGFVCFFVGFFIKKNTKTNK